MRSLRCRPAVGRRVAQLGGVLDGRCSYRIRTRPRAPADSAADGRAQSVIGIDASFTPAQTKAQVLDIARNTSALVGVRDNAADDIVLFEDYAYPCYGVPSKETLEAIRLSARLEGMITDPVYEGKSMQGLIDLVRKGYFPAGSKVLYAHLGGAPALNGYSYTFRNG